MFRAFRFDLHPTAEQAETLRQFAGVSRLVYNLALSQRRDFWRQYKRVTGQRLSWASQSREVTDLRREHEWIAAVPRSTLECALRDVDKAFAAFFAGRCRYPTPRQKGRDDAFRFQARCYTGAIRALNGNWSEIQIPRVGWVRFRSTRSVLGRSISATVREGPAGWSIAVATEIEHIVPSNDAPSIGIDRGVAVSLCLSNGEQMNLPAGTMALARRMRRQERALSRRKRGSRRWSRQRRRVAAVYAKIGRVRREFHHRAALSIAQRFGVVALENLNVRGMTASAAGTVAEPGRKVRQKSGLNRVILNQGWSAFETILAYKLEERGGRLVKVPAAYSSQTCPTCGVIDAESRKSQAVFSCVSCGHTANADHNAAIEILRRLTSGLDVEGLHSSSPREASTGSSLAA